MPRHREIRTVALIDPVGDAGIGGYTHELAGGLAANGVRVDVYTRAQPFAERLPRRYRLVPVLGTSWRAHRRALSEADGESTPLHPALAPAMDTRSSLDGYFDLLEYRRSNPPRTIASSATQPVARRAPRAEVGGSGHAMSWPQRITQTATQTWMSVDLALHLRRRQYDVIWTQWPDLGPAGTVLRTLCKTSGVRLVHTVHNVLPHERFPGDTRLYGTAYRDADALVVHSDAAARALAAHFPLAREKTVCSRHGLYTIYPRVPAMRTWVRRRLALRDDQTALLVFGGVRPYKNLDATLDAMRDERCRDVVLIVAGWEWGYSDYVPGDRLGRTRAVVARLGLEHRVRLLPGPFGVRQTAELFEASDAVALPYLESFGSGVLCMAMTYRKHVLATPVGGMDEYFDGYARHTMLAGSTAADIADAIAQLDSPSTLPPDDTPADASPLAWPAVAGRALADLAAMRV
jgi:glycosyltransferase involved in cell wall biosynthesis